MSLFEFFRQKQIKITPETQVTVQYLTAANVADLYDMATGDLLLVKRRITAEDAQRLQICIPEKAPCSPPSRKHWKKWTRRRSSKAA